jgi:myxalamid-type polyketide synthase MxaE and MxaD
MTEPIAIVGLGCRFPGAPGPGAYWRLLARGGDAIVDVPRSRWDNDALYDPDPLGRGTVVTRSGGFLDEVDGFDWRAFGISRREAVYMDPQHRLLLEVSWEALEDAGIPPGAIAGTRGSVFIGLKWNDYLRMQMRDPAQLDGYSATGNALSFAANRLSYFYDLRGPSIAFDVSCASSLIAVHLACQSLRSGDAEIALAGGVNLMLSPDTLVMISRAGVLSPEGRCKTFDARADGFARGEGAGIVVLKTLARAERDGDRVYAVVRGSAFHHNGRTEWIMAPEADAQVRMITEAWAQAGLDPSAADYVELHGTGTKKGDPIEARAMGEMFGRNRGGHPCRVGSVKTNFGHLETAAGVAGFEKTVLALWRRTIPPNLHFSEVNAEIDLDALGLAVPTVAEPWPVRERAVTAGVHSLSLGGANAHVVLESSAPRPPAIADEARAHLLPLSAKSAGALRGLAGAWRDFLVEGDREGSLGDATYTASERRGHFEHRAAIVGGSRTELVAALGAFVEGRAHPGVALGRAVVGARPVFVYSGQGSQWWAMGRALLAAEPLARAVVEECDALARPLAGWSLLEELARDEASSRLGETALAQPALFALQAALTALLRAWGVAPAAVVGHSVGEIAAAHAAGVLGLAQAVRVACERGRIMQRATGLGKMAQTSLAPGALEPLLSPFGARLSLAAHNGPSTTVVAGEAAALDELSAALAAGGAPVRPLPVNYAFHSAQMDPFGPEIAEALAGLTTTSPSLPVYSTVTASAWAPSDFDAAYWSRQLRAPVRFAGAIDALVAAGHSLFVEIGPHPVLATALSECLRARGVEGAPIATLRGGADDRARLLEAAGALYTRGVALDFGAIAPRGRVVSLPTYAWQRERLWFQASGAEPTRAIAAPARDGEALLERHFAAADGTGLLMWETALSPDRFAWLDDHKVAGTVVLPASGYIEMVLEAAAAGLGLERCLLRDVEFRRALRVKAGEPCTLQLLLAPSSAAGAWSFRIFSRSRASGAGELHATGTLEPARDPAPAPLAPDALRARLAEELSGAEVYAELSARGEQYGPAFQCIERIWREPFDASAGSAELLARVRAPRDRSYRFAPATLDACLHALVLGAPRASNSGFVPTRIDAIAVEGRAAGPLWSRATLDPSARAHGHEQASVSVFDESGRPLLEARGLTLQYLDEQALRAAFAETALYELDWRPTPAAAPGPAAREPWIVLADRGGVAEALAARMAGAGEACALAGSAEEALALLERPAAGVVSLRALDAPALEAASSATVDAALARSCTELLPIVRSLAGRAAGPRLWLVTRGAQSVGGAPRPMAPLQAPAWGFGRAFAEEHPALWGGLVDLDPSAATAASAESLWQALHGTTREDQRAIRDGAARVARLRPMAPAVSTPLRWRADASYLVTGGLGDLGLAVARWMARGGARRLVLVGRTALPPRPEWAAATGRDAARIEVVRELESLGATVDVAAVDVGDEAALRAFVDSYRAGGAPPFRGVIHAAGVGSFRPLAEMSGVDLDAVFRAKVRGGWLLHEVFAGEPLDAFVLFSSSSSVLGSPLLAHYAAANAFLDALAQHRRALGRPALSVQWGAWGEVGMVTQHAGRGPATLRGTGLIAPAEGLRTLERLLGQAAPVALAATIDWAEWRRLHPAAASAPLLEELVGGAQRPTETSADARLIAQLAAAPPDERGELLGAELTRELSTVLGFAPEPRQKLFDAGLDSLMALELKNRLERRLGLALPATTLFEHPTAQSLAVHLAALLGPRETPPAPPPPLAAPEPPPSPASDEELAAALDAEIAKATRRLGD